MRIGIDFDNTIACYDGLFHKVALEQGLISDDVAINKVAVRDHLKNAGKEPVWTELQGYVYGKRMDEADIFSGVFEFIFDSIIAGDTVFIVSHKTRHPVIGPDYDLHQAARDWISLNLVEDGKELLSLDQVFFEPTRKEKLARIKNCDCEVFIDDLPEVLESPEFPESTMAILFDPESHHSDIADMPVYTSWQQISTFLRKLG